MNCTTHHHACDCREAAHAAEVERLTQERDKAQRELQGSQDFHAAIRQTCLARGFDGTWTDDAVTALAEAYDARGAEVESLRAVVAAVRAEAERLVAVDCDDASIDPRVDPSAAFAEAANEAGDRILALLPREG